MVARLIEGRKSDKDNFLGFSKMTCRSDANFEFCGVSVVPLVGFGTCLSIGNACYFYLLCMGSTSHF